MNPVQSDKSKSVSTNQNTRETQDGPVVQWYERLIRNQEVAGPNPARSTRFLIASSSVSDRSFQQPFRSFPHAEYRLVSPLEEAECHLRLHSE